ncbi:MAG: GNAT family N-acetyltransferase [Anaerolineales bacterium]|nr:GNAT family N-acetyltransferase [Anaerolineales bacterium]
MKVVVQSLTNRQLDAFQDHLVRIYRDAFSVFPYFEEDAEVEDFARSLPLHVESEGFRIVVALRDPSEQVVGFAYGLANTTDQFWYKRVAKAVEPWVLTEWLRGSFRLVEMAVTPEAQGQGIGGLLHDHLLIGLSYRKAVLSTLAAETSAYWMYLKRGWRVLLDDYFFPGVARPYRIMGLELGGGEDNEP